MTIAVAIALILATAALLLALYHHHLLRSVEQSAKSVGDLARQVQQDFRAIRRVEKELEESDRKRAERFG